MWTRRTLLLTGLAAGAALRFAGPARAATDQLIVALPAEPPHLDPTADAPASTLDVAYANLFEGLTRIDRTGAVAPGLAKSWTVSPDGLAYTFSLQPQARFHDGTAFDAGHVVFSLQRPAAVAGLPAVAGVTATDQATVTLQLRQPDADLPHRLALPSAVMVAPESADNNREVPIGTGPFALLQWDAGNEIALVRNEDYWGPHPRISEVSFVFVADPGFAVDALLKREIGGYPNFPDAARAAALRGNPVVTVVDGKGPDGAPRIGFWDSRLSGMWPDAPIESCILADLRWAGDTGVATPSPQDQTED